ncbi:MAG TPA: FkbM family methyltransferase [Hanamia sp.]
MKKIFNFIYNHPLAGKHKIRASFLFFSWQLSQLFYPHEVLVPFVGTTKLVAKKGLTGATGNIYTGLEEFSDMGFLLHFLRKDDLFADIGANIGSYSVLASGCVGARTICFEPVPSTFYWLTKNINVNSLHQSVVARNIGLGSVKTELYFTSSHGTVNHVLSQNEIEYQNDTVKVQVFPFDEIALQEGIPQLIKIDVEGFETEVIRGMKNTLQSNELKAIIIELNGSGGRYGYDESLIHQELSDLNFFPHEYNPFTRNLERIESYSSTNTIYIKDYDFVKDRIVSAEKVLVFSEKF